MPPPLQRTSAFPRLFPGSPERLRAAGRGGGRGLALIAALALIGFGCARAPLVLVSLVPETLTPPGQPGAVSSYDALIRMVSAVMVAELGLPLPSRFAVLVYPTRAAYADGLARVGQMPARRAAEIAAYSVGLGQHRRLFINDETLQGAPRATRLGVVTHELTHVAQYELSGGRRGHSEQWLREGMAEWVACWMLDRLGESTFFHERYQAGKAVALDLPALQSDPPDLVDLGRPGGWETRHLRSGDRITYRLAFLLTDELVRRHGFDRLIAYFRAFADSDDRFGHFQRTFGRSLREFEADALSRIRDEVEEPRRVDSPGRADAPRASPSR